MSSPARANNNDIEKKKLTREVESRKSEPEKPLEFSDFKEAVEMSPAMQRIYEKLGGENISDKQKFLERVWDLAADELVAMVKAWKEGPEIDELLDFQEKINKILEKNGAVGDQKEEDCLPGGTCQGIDLDETVNLRKKK